MFMLARLGLWTLERCELTNLRCLRGPPVTVSSVNRLYCVAGSAGLSGNAAAICRECSVKEISDTDSVQCISVNERYPTSYIPLRPAKYLSELILYIF